MSDPKPAAKKGPSGCIIAVLVVAGLTACSCVVASVVMGRAAQNALESDTGKKVLTAVGKGIDLANKSAHEPGIAELERAGCQKVTIFDGDALSAFVGELVDAGQRELRDAPKGKMIACLGGRFDTLPDCDQLAHAYVDAVHPATVFTVSVCAEGDRACRCVKHYAQTGEPRPSP